MSIKIGMEGLEARKSPRSGAKAASAIRASASECAKM